MWLCNKLIVSAVSGCVICESLEGGPHTPSKSLIMPSHLSEGRGPNTALSHYMTCQGHPKPQNYLLGGPPIRWKSISKSLSNEFKSTDCILIAQRESRTLQSPSDCQPTLMSTSFTLLYGDVYVPRIHLSYIKNMKAFSLLSVHT